MMRGRGDQESGVTCRLGRSRSRQVLRRKSAWQPHAGSPEGGSRGAYDQVSITQVGTHIGYRKTRNMRTSIKGVGEEANKVGGSAQRGHPPDRPLRIMQTAQERPRMGF